VEVQFIITNILQILGARPGLDKANRVEAPKGVREEDVRQGEDEEREKDGRIKDGRKDVGRGEDER